MDRKQRLSVVIPTFNEQDRLGTTLNQLRSISSSFASLEVVISDDGSTDNTLKVARNEGHGLTLKAIRNPHLGPGEAIRAGVLASAYEWVLLSDADGPVDFNTVLPMLTLAQECDFDVLSGRRIGPGARIDHPQPIHRRLMGHLWRYFVRYGVGSSFSDPQCGFKLFRAPCAKEIFQLSKSSSFGIHIETMLLAMDKGYSVHEYPVSWRDRDGSKIRPVRDSITMLTEALCTRRRLGRTSPRQAYRSHSSAV